MSSHPPSLPALRSRLKTIDNEIYLLEARLRALRAERTPIAASLDAVVYPVLSLPTELTAHIFSLSIESPHIGTSTYHLNHRHPFFLGAVCRQWRDVSLATHSLWAKFEIHPPMGYLEGPSDAVDRMLQILRCYLQRAGSNPLDIFIEGTASVDSDNLRVEPETMSRIYYMLRPLWPQIARIHLPFEPATFPSADLGPNVAQLRALSISLPIGSEPPATPIDSFAVAPLLRNASFDGFRSGSDLVLPWRQLLSLSIEEMELDHCLAILRQTPQLEIFTYADLGPTGGDAQNLTLSNLRSIRSFSLDGDLQLLDFLTLPALDSIRAQALTDAAHTSVIALVGRSRCTLSRVHLARLPLPALYKTLEPLNTGIKELLIPTDRLQDREVIADRIRTDATFIPNVHTLSIQHSRRYPSTAISIIPAIAEAIATRWTGNLPGAAPIRRLRVEVDRFPVGREIGQEFLLILEPLLKEGFELVFSPYEQF
ncbi:F-box domain-containing protein [Mycena kentingensis (nom. inval.)]|nr:F-box domain-containing protein [Mycena kentingensis (nom. inval.)]